MLEPEDICEPEWAEWYRLTPQERWAESQKLWSTYLALGGSLDPEPDTQSPFFDADEGVRHLLMGGQACVFYGAAEFSRDTDLAILADDENLSRLRDASTIFRRSVSTSLLSSSNTSNVGWLFISAVTARMLRACEST